MKFKYKNIPIHISMKYNKKIILIYNYNLPFVFILLNYIITQYYF